MKPNHIELIVNAIEEGCDVVEGGFCQIGINGDVSENIFPSAVHDLSLDCKGFYHKPLLNVIEKVGNAPWNKLFRRSFLLDNQIEFDTRFTMNEDRIFMMQAFLCARKWKFIPMTGYVYKASLGSAMSRYHDNVEGSWNVYLDLNDRVKQRVRMTTSAIQQERINLQYYLTWKYIWNIFKPGCPWNWKEKILYIHEYIKKDDFKLSLREQQWKREPFCFKIFHVCVLTHSATIVALLFFTPHHLKHFLNKIVSQS